MSDLLRLPQLFETSLALGEGSLWAHFWALPRRSIPTGGQEETPSVEAVLDDLGFTKLLQLDPARISSALAALVSYADDYVRKDIERAGESVSADSVSAALRTVSITEVHLALADYLCHEEIIPFERSPISGISLNALTKNVSGVAIGSYVGIVMGNGTPYLLVTVPVGIIVCCITCGAGRALEKIVQRRVEEMMNGKSRTRK